MVKAFLSLLLRIFFTSPEEYNIRSRRFNLLKVAATGIILVGFFFFWILLQRLYVLANAHITLKKEYQLVVQENQELKRQLGREESDNKPFPLMSNYWYCPKFHYQYPFDVWKLGDTGSGLYIPYSLYGDPFKNAQPYRR